MSGTNEYNDVCPGKISPASLHFRCNFFLSTSFHFVFFALKCLKSNHVCTNHYWFSIVLQSTHHSLAQWVLLLPLYFVVRLNALCVVNSNNNISIFFKKIFWIFFLIFLKLNWNSRAIIVFGSAYGTAKAVSFVWICF